MDTKDILFIRPRLKHDYYHDNVLGLGMNILIPYKDYNLALRVIREVWFRLNLPCREVWYNKKIKKIDSKYIILKDPLITLEYLEWLRKIKPNSTIILSYANRVNEHLLDPGKAKRFVDAVYSYDSNDCSQYGLLKRHEVYLDYFKVKKRKDILYDAVYVGRDKGRASLVFEIQEQLNKQGLNTYFHISPTRSYMLFRKAYYKPVISYDKYLELIGSARALINIVPNNRANVTLRDMESVFNSKKCITNNLEIEKFDLYDPSRFFILGKDDINTVSDFIRSDYKKVDDSLLEKYTFSHVVKEMISEVEASNRHTGNNPIVPGADIA